MFSYKSNKQTMNTTNKPICWILFFLDFFLCSLYNAMLLKSKMKKYLTQFIFLYIYLTIQNVF